MKTLEEKAESLYSDKLLYHNFNHALETIETAMELVWECFSLGIEINSQVVYYACLFHDAGLHKFKSDNSFKNEESYSAHIASSILKKYNLQNSTIKAVQECIASTNPAEELKTKEAKIVRASDIYNISSDYKDFIDKNIAIKLEREQKLNKTIKWDEWKKTCKNNIAKYYSDELIIDNQFQLISFDKIKENIDKFINEDNNKLDSRQKILFPKL